MICIHLNLYGEVVQWLNCMGETINLTNDPSLICNNCRYEVRPIDLLGDGFLSCPNCQTSLMEEVDRYNQRYNLSQDGGE